MLKSIQKWLHNNFMNKYGFGWLYRDFFLHAPILLATNCIYCIHIINNTYIVICSCDYDFVAIYDGPSRTSKLIAKFCGRDEVQVVSSGRYLFIEFVSDDSTQFAGFKLRYHFQQASGILNWLFFLVLYQCLAWTFKSIWNVDLAVLDISFSGYF